MIDDYPGQGATEVDKFMHKKGHDAGRKHIVLHVGIPGCPQALEDVQMDIVLGYLVELTPVGLWGRVEQGRC